MIAINKESFSARQSFTFSPIALFTPRNFWYFNTGVTNYLCNICNIYTSYIEYNISQAIESICGSIMFIDKGIIRLNI